MMHAGVIVNSSIRHIDSAVHMSDAAQSSRVVVGPSL